MGLKKKIENHIITVIVLVVIGTTSIVWVVSEQIRVKPLERKIADHDTTITTLNNTVKELRNDPDRQKVEALKSELGATKSSLKQWQDALPLWQEENSKLTQKLNLYLHNCSIISELHILDSRKTELERIINDHILAGSSNDDAKAIEWHRQAEQYQIRILDLQKRLLCQQP